jgi:hypothetical protein
MQDAVYLLSVTRKRMIAPFFSDSFLFLSLPVAERCALLTWLLRRCSGQRIHELA